MKIPLTDKFLLDLYNLTEKTTDTLGLFVPPRTMNELFYPELFKKIQKYEKEQSKRRFSQFIYYLKRKGYIKIDNLRQRKTILLTKKGADKIFKIRFQIEERKIRDDGKWNMIIFDIPERKRGLRKLLRENLYILGYKMLQQSVWISPYDVSKETEEILQKYSLDRYVKLFLIEKI